MRKFIVVETLCHRKDVVGRATIALRLQRVKKHPDDPLLGVRTRGQKRKFEESRVEELHDESYVLKLIWRDPGQESEGEVLEQLVGIYGVVQYVWHCDVSTGGRGALDETAQVDDLLVCKNLVNLDFCGRSDVNTKKLELTDHTRRHRVYSRILLSSVGKPLWNVQSPRDLLTGILDAILGYWRLVTMGIIHRDISQGNVMLLPPGQNFRRREWKEPIEDLSALSDLEAKLREYVLAFDRDPTGIVSDFDMHMQLCDTESTTGSVKSEPRDSIDGSVVPESVSRDTPEDEPHAKRRKMGSSYLPIVAHGPRQTRPSQRTDRRVGTVAFMSTRVLGVQPGERYEHTFMDDLESFFWVLFYSVFDHLEPGVDRRTVEAIEVLKQLDNSRLSISQVSKSGYIKSCFKTPSRMIAKLREAGNNWGVDEKIVSVILQLGSFFYDDGDVALEDMTPIQAFPRIVDIFVDALKE